MRKHMQHSRFLGQKMGQLFKALDVVGCRFSVFGSQKMKN